ncbi:unnamed protein product [Ectocarpus sp. 13 AM-2016]
MAPAAPTRCFFDVAIGGEAAGRMVFKLYTETVPLTAENFRCLCTGEKGEGRTTGRMLHYKGVPFHRVIPGFMCQGGDFERRNGTGGESIYGGKFKDEPAGLKLKHNKKHLLSMANAGRNSNGSQFFITTHPASHLDGLHVVFGELESGADTLAKMSEVETDKKDAPISLQRVIIEDCGELLASRSSSSKHHRRHSSRDVGREEEAGGGDSDDGRANGVGSGMKKRQSGGAARDAPDKKKEKRDRKALKKERKKEKKAEKKRLKKSKRKGEEGEGKKKQKKHRRHHRRHDDSDGGSSSSDDSSGEDSDASGGGADRKRRKRESKKAKHAAKKSSSKDAKKKEKRAVQSSGSSSSSSGSSSDEGDNAPRGGGGGGHGKGGDHHRAVGNGVSAASKENGSRSSKPANGSSSRHAAPEGRRAVSPSPPKREAATGRHGRSRSRGRGSKSPAARQDKSASNAQDAPDDGRTRYKGRGGRVYRTPSPVRGGRADRDRDDRYNNRPRDGGGRDGGGRYGDRSGAAPQQQEQEQEQEEGRRGWGRQARRARLPLAASSEEVTRSPWRRLAGLSEPGPPRPEVSLPVILAQQEQAL